MNAKKTKSKISGASVFVLMIGDEGAVLTQIHKNRVVKRLFAQSPDAMHVRGFEEALDNAPDSPVTILFDMMDQSYIRQTLPPVSSFSIGKIITRRLTKDFSPDDIKGYVILDREKTGRKDWNYMMVSLAMSSVLQKWIAFAVERPNPFHGMGLVPLESQRLIQALEKKFLQDKEKGAKPLEWQILVSHNKIGGFRQIVLRAGKLVFTRMAQPFGESLPDVIAGNIEQEMVNTFEYLKRFGLQDSSAISITVICSEDIKRAIDLGNIKAGERRIFNPYEVANLLSLEGAAQPEDSFGDVIISAFIAKRKRLILPLNTPYTKKLSNLSLGIKLVKASACLAVLAVILWAGMNVYDILGANHNIEELDAKHKTLNASLTEIKTRATTLPKNVSQYSDIMAMSQTFIKKQYDILQLTDNLAAGIRNMAAITSIHWTVSNNILAEMDMHLTLPGQEPAAKLPGDIKSLMDSLKNSLPDFNFTYPDVPGIISDTKDIRTIIGGSGNSAEAAPQVQNTSFKITMTGPLTDKASKTPRNAR